MHMDRNQRLILPRNCFFAALFFLRLSSSFLLIFRRTPRLLRTIMYGCDLSFSLFVDPPVFFFDRRPNCGRSSRPASVDASFASRVAARRACREEGG